MTNMQRLTFLLVSVAWSVVINAQAPDTLTLENCIRLAEENSYQLQADNFEIAVAENAVTISEPVAIIASDSRQNPKT